MGHPSHPRAVAVLLLAAPLAIGPGCGWLDDEDVMIWNQLTATHGDETGEPTFTCMPIAGDHNQRIETGVNGTGWAEYILSENYRLYWAYYTAPAGSPLWFEVTPETGELAAEFEFEHDTLDPDETISGEFETHYGSRLDVLFWSGDCEDEDPQPPPQE